MLLLLSSEFYMLSDSSATKILVVNVGYFVTFQVHIAADAVSSRTQTDRILALDRMRQIGAFINTTESIILSWVGDAKHPRFKEVQKLIKEINLDTGLVTNEAAEASIVAKAAL